MTTVRPTSSRNFIQVLDCEKRGYFRLDLDLPAIEVLVYQSLVTSVKNLQNLIVLWKKNLEKIKIFRMEDHNTRIYCRFSSILPPQLEKTKYF